MPAGTLKNEFDIDKRDSRTEIMSKIFESEVFSLRALNQTDADSITKHANNYNVWINLTDAFPFPYSKKDALEFIGLQQKSPVLNTFGIEVKGEVVGVIGFSQKEGNYRVTAEIGYWISEEFWGQGIVTLAVKEISDYIFTEFEEIVKVYAKVYLRNKASARVLEKAGFIHEATLQKACIKEKEILDLKYYAKFRN